MRSFIQLVPLLLAGSSLTSAFLIPPSIKHVATEAISSVTAPLALNLGFDPFKQKIELEYSGPYYEGEIHGIRTYSDLKHTLAFDIQGNPEQPWSLAINGHEIFQLNEKSLEPFQATQLPKEDNKLALVHLPQPRVNINYEVFINPIAPGVKSIRFHVLSVDGLKTPRDMDIIELIVFQDPQGIIYIGKVEARHPTPSEASAAECKQSLICRWKAYFADRLHSISNKGSQGKKPGCHGKRPPHPPSNSDSKHGHKHLDHDDKHHPHKQHKEHHLKVLHLIRHALFIGTFSILLGIILGTLLMFVVMVLGYISAKTYTLVTGNESALFRGCRGCTMYKKVASTDEEVGSFAEEKMLVVEIENEELPAYTDSEGVLRGDEKSEL